MSFLALVPPYFLPKGKPKSFGGYPRKLQTHFPGTQLNKFNFKKRAPFFSPRRGGVSSNFAVGMLSGFWLLFGSVDDRAAKHKVFSTPIPFLGGSHPSGS